MFEKEGVDVREARLSLTPKGNMMAILAAGVWKDGSYLSLAPYVSFSDKSGLNFSPLEKTVIGPAITPSLDFLNCLFGLIGTQNIIFELYCYCVE